MIGIYEDLIGRAVNVSANIVTMRDWQGKRVIIIGAARQGTALARYLARSGAEVVLNDHRNPGELQSARQALAGERVEWSLGSHPLSLLEDADLVCPSGGVPLSLPLVKEARRLGIPLANDSQLFLEAAPCKVIGITGSAGKTTTTTLVGRIARAAQGEFGGQPQPTGEYRHVWVGGNIGNPLIDELEAIDADDLAVMELSSFQLEVMTKAPDIAVLLNLTPNHLDRHGSMAAYVAAKARILENQPAMDDQGRLSAAVLNREDQQTWALADRVRGQLVTFGIAPMLAGGVGTFVEDDSLYLQDETGAAPIMPVSEIALHGEHNLLNVLAACATAYAAGLPIAAMRAGVRGFGGVPHRLEYVRTWGGADWYNDSIATAPERSLAAIRSFEEPLILLAGGRDKDLPWDEFARVVVRRVEHLVLFGEAADQIAGAIEAQGESSLNVVRAAGLRKAVHAAAELASRSAGESGGEGAERLVVLLSPGGTSFDEFRDFEDRGEAFKQWVMELP